MRRASSPAGPISISPPQRPQHPVVRRDRRRGLAGVDGERQIAFIIAIPELERGSTGTELPSNVTLIEEGQGRFFSTPDLNNCFTDITTFEAVGESTSAYAVGGTLYCLQPIAEVNGSSSISLDEMRFRGLLDWSDG